jgi:hypothetical protein
MYWRVRFSKNGKRDIEKKAKKIIFVEFCGIDFSKGEIENIYCTVQPLGSSLFSVLSYICSVI